MYEVSQLARPAICRGLTDVRSKSPECCERQPGALSLLISITVFYLISVATPRRPIAADVEAVMDM